MDKAKELFAKFQQDLRLIEGDIAQAEQNLKALVDRKARLMGGLETSQAILATDPSLGAGAAAIPASTEPNNGEETKDTEVKEEAAKAEETTADAVAPTAPVDPSANAAN